MKIQKIIRKNGRATAVVEGKGNIWMREFPASMSDAEIAAAALTPKPKKPAKGKDRKNA